ncbi:major facilitator superfamily domain-containing protein [Microdochium trichocladiopsis]|uniref:Major facilitator superfamily domain-containing protein n=1 Tax=Microdochium trichocladiopsis TaxID=1682393 RepID=A0A9P8XS94_9PEZI|nr:major facilitator superfamily domain-containing protein [Microdochium trichocladiopsis]KAH7014484.1 major facilitator superfamily domain-containing protein [Microdochium trichocladiopsis]
MKETITASSSDVESALPKPPGGEPDQPRQGKEKQPVVSSWTTSPYNPYTWPTSRKVTIILIVSLSHLATTMSASMMAASLEQIAAELHMDPATTLLASSIFLLGLGFGPFLVGPMSELYGRRPVWLLCNCWYLLWNSLCPVGRSSGMLIASRLMAGFGASCGIGLLGPVSADMYGASERGKSIAIATFLPYIGPALGPIVGGLASEHIHWSWTFWILSIFNAVATAAGFFLIKESYGPIVQERHGFLLSSPSNLTIGQKIKNNLLRPVRMLIFRPVILFVSFNMALDFAVYFLVLSTFATLWIEEYNQSESTSSLHYIAITLGATVATQIGGRLMDATYKTLSTRAQTKARAAQEPESGDSHTQREEEEEVVAHINPEFRIPFVIPSLILTPVGLLWYAWTAERHVHWAVVDLGIAVFTLANFMFSAGFQAYMLDEFSGGGGGGASAGSGSGGNTAASATAAVKLLSYILAFVFPLFAPRMYEVLGYGWGNTLLALLFAGLAVPSALVAWIWGEKLRALGRERV